DGTELGVSQIFSSIGPGNGGVTVTAQAFEELNITPARVLIQDTTGIGVTTDNDGSEAGSADQVDGQGSSSEGILFSFSATVTLEEILFGSVGGNDGARVFVDLAGGGTGFTELTPGASLLIGTDDDAFQLTNALIDRIAIAATDANDDFFVAGFDIAAVPVPAAGVLFASALGLAGLWRRRAAKTA
ncbi:MAG: hypothetical protein AAF337_14340, partial [Pseudomonadota bacterium]